MRIARIHLVELALLAGLLACSGKVDDTAAGGGESGGGESGGDSGGESGGEAGDGGTDDGSSGEGAGGADEDDPQAEILDAFCTVQVTGDTRAVWTVLATASDPQGADTLVAIVDGGVQVSQGGVEVGRYSLSCAVVDLDSADCTGTFVAFGDGTSCGDATSYSIVVEAEDEDGNRGASAPVTGREE